MSIVVTTKDCTALSDAELAEMADMAVEHVPGYDIGYLSKEREEWVLVTDAREDSKLRAYSFCTLERIGGTPSLLVGLAVVAPRMAAWLVAVDGAIARGLLGPRRREELARRVDELEVSRGAALDQAEAERRRIERDLHDGAQQRLVALAMDLSRARERFDADPQRARQLLEAAHEEAKAALVELRNLARGVHPAVLAERGLDAALASVVARCPLPVSLSVDVAVRPPAPVESAAYFVVAESLTNVTKHAEATEVAIVVARQQDRLLIEVRDDGRGGARIAPGGGLAGLSDRVTALGGWMRVLSPPGGPTSVLVELRCRS